MRAISTDTAPKAVGPYSQGISIGSLIFVSGQTPIDPATGVLAQGGIAEQAEQACKNVKAVLEAAGTSMAQVIKTTCFLVDMADFQAFNAVYERYFISCPARSCVAVKALPKNSQCEIEAIALPGEAQA